MSRIIRIARIIIGALFACAGAWKLRDLDSFTMDIFQFMIFTYPFSAKVAIALPLAEIVTGIGVMAGSLLCIDALITLLTLFLFAILYGIFVTGIGAHPCGCFGATAAMPIKYDLYRVVILLAAAIWLRRETGRRINKENKP